MNAPGRGGGGGSGGGGTAIAKLLKEISKTIQNKIFNIASMNFFLFICPPFFMTITSEKRFV